jgi:hypothetical protein
MGSTRDKVAKLEITSTRKTILMGGYAEVDK